MAIVKNVKFARYSGNVPPNDVLGVVQDMYDWEKIEKDGQNYKLWVNDSTYLLIGAGTVNTSATLSLFFNGVQVGSTMGYSSVNNAYYGLMHIVKTNSATVIQFGNTNADSITEVGITNGAFIFSNGINRVTGETEKLASYINSMTLQSGATANYVCSKDVITSTIDLSTVGVIYASHALTTMTPFTAKESRVALTDVYLCRNIQPSAVYRGACTLNGRKYYMIGLIMLLDE